MRELTLETNLYIFCKGFQLHIDGPFIMTTESPKKDVPVFILTAEMKVKTNGYQLYVNAS